MNAAWVTLTVDGSEMETYLALPDDPGPAPGVVVAHYAGGVDAFIRGIVERFAGDGLAAICPKDGTVFVDDEHFNESGARIVADAIADRLLRRDRPSFATLRD